MRYNGMGWVKRFSWFDAIMLDRPRVVTQDPRTCWAAAFESWADADAAMNNTTNSRDMNQLISDFDRWGMTRNDRLTLRGMRLLASLGMMRMREHHPGRLTPTRISEMLTEFGYLYFAVYGHLINNVRRGHALVCYGVDDSRIYVMDPWARSRIPADPGVTLRAEHRDEGVCRNVADHRAFPVDRAIVQRFSCRTRQVEAYKKAPSYQRTSAPSAPM